jgi:KUP system potassium uptake protein
VEDEDRVEVSSLGHDCWKVQVHFGFMDVPDVPQAIDLIKQRGGFSMDPMTTSYFLSRDIVVPTVDSHGMAAWREKLFAQMHLNASSAADFLRLPNNAVVELGSKIEI